MAGMSETDYPIAPVFEAYNRSVRDEDWRLRVVQLGSGVIGFTLPRSSGRRWGVSPRQREVLELRSEGLTNARVATRLSLGEGSVKAHVSNLYLGLAADDISEAYMKLAVLEQPSFTASARDVPALLSRQLLLCTGVVLGMTNKQIGGFMKPGERPLREDTISKELAEPFNKLGLTSRDQMAKRLLEPGIFVALPRGYEA